jgi:hypothetical protein
MRLVCSGSRGRLNTALVKLDLDNVVAAGSNISILLFYFFFREEAAGMQ